MPVYTSGQDTTPGDQTSLQALEPGEDYIFQYHAPTIAFAFISPDHLTSIIEEWINLRSKLEQLQSDEVLTIDGVLINTDTGDIYIRGSVSGAPAVVESGVNPWAVAAVIGAIFAAIGIGISLLYVYKVGNKLVGSVSNSPGPTADPCTEDGVLNYVECLANETSWLIKGAIVGALALLLFIVFRERP